MSTRNQLIVEATASILVQAINAQPDPISKMHTAMSVGFHGLVINAGLLMGSGLKVQEGIYPSMDHILLASFMIQSSCSMSSDATVRVEFSPARVLECLDDFQKFTGRSGEHLVDPVLLDSVKKATTVDLSKFGANRKFLQ